MTPAQPGKLATPVYELIEAVLREAGQPLTTEEIVTKLEGEGVAFKSIQNSLGKLQQWGRVERLSGQGLGRGRYRLAGTEPSEITPLPISRPPQIPYSVKEGLPTAPAGWWRVMGRLFSDPQDAIERAEERWEAGKRDFTVEWSGDGQAWTVIFEYRSLGTNVGGFGGGSALEGLEGWEERWAEGRMVRTAVAA